MYNDKTVVLTNPKTCSLTQSQTVAFVSLVLPHFIYSIQIVKPGPLKFLLTLYYNPSIKLPETVSDYGRLPYLHHKVIYVILAFFSEDVMT